MRKMRITQKDLETAVKRLNLALDRPLVSYSDDGTAMVGNYHIDHAYGGVSLHKMVNARGGVTDIFGCGHIAKRDLYNRIHAILVAVEDRL
jgi:hypothetical protein